MSLDKAVERAITECIREGILAEFLKKNRAEAKKMSIYEYDEERHMRQTREEGMEDGISQAAANMLKMREFTDEQIKAVTGLKQQQLNELKKEQAGLVQK